MKRTICFLLALLMVILFVGCKKKDTTPQQQTEPTEEVYDLVECMKNGKIPELKYTLGTAADTIKNDYHYDKVLPEEQLELVINENPNSINISVGDYYFYYEREKEDKGISSIVAFTTAFGVEVQGFETKASLQKKFSKTTFTERKLTSLEAYFIPGEVENCSALTCESDNRRIDFIFMDETLIAINLVDTENWTLT